MGNFNPYKSLKRHHSHQQYSTHINITKRNMIPSSSTTIIQASSEYVAKDFNRKRNRNKKKIFNDNNHINVQFHNAIKSKSVPIPPQNYNDNEQHRNLGSLTDKELEDLLESDHLLKYNGYSNIVQ